LQALAAYIMRSPLQGIVAAGLLGLLTLAFPPLPLANATVSLWVLRKGLPQGLMVMIGGAAFAALLLALMRYGSPGHAVLFLWLWWSFSVVGSVALRRFESQGAMLAVLAASGIALVVLWRWASGDPVDQWEGWLAQLHEAAPQLGLTEARRAVLAPYMTGMTVGMTVAVSAAAVLLGRWWQAILYNPGGFGQEFRILRMPRSVTYLAGLAVAIALVNHLAGRAGGVAADVLIVLMFAFMFQGLAVLHHTARQRQWPRLALSVAYLMMALLSQLAVPAFAVLGVLDTVNDFRRLNARADSG
jgi:hypothetical protein